MIRISTILLLLLVSISAVSQSMGERETDYTFYEGRVSRTHKVNVKVEGDLEQYLENKFNIDITKTHEFENRVGKHYTFEHLHDGIVVYNSILKAHINKSGNLFMVQENLVDTRAWGNLTKLDNTIPEKIAKQFNVRITTKKQVVYMYNNSPTVAWEIRTQGIVTYQSYEYLIDKDLNVLYARDLKRYSAPPPPPDSVVKAAVFLPDPLTTAEQNYGSPYLDLGDSNVQEINDELDTVEMRVKYDLNTFYLENQYFSMGNVSPPNNIIVLSGTPEFYFGRGDDAFEYVNCFYHLNVYKDYLFDIGCGALVDTIVIDPHAHNGADQSSFDGNNTPWTLEYGDGGVDDGEDADVIIHEYGHSFVEMSSPNTFVGNERRSLEEGLCDYLAVSYSRAFSDHDWFKVFNWDGHNEYWDGRTAKTDKRYPEDLSGTDIHTNGEMFATALMESWELIGREEMDKILLESLPFLTQNQSMSDYAEAIITVDNNINGGANYKELMIGFVHRGILNWPVNVPQVDKTPSVSLNGSYEFSIGAAPATIRALNTSIVSYSITNSLGRVIVQKYGLSTDEISINPATVVTGIYFVNVKTVNGDYVFKLLKH